MAIQKSVTLTFRYVGDGTSTSYSFNLLTDPYSVPVATENWYATNRSLAGPVGVLPSGSLTCSLSGDVVTVTFSTAPPINASIAGTIFIQFA